jgi:hypothetical protein
MMAATSTQPISILVCPVLERAPSGSLGAAEAVDPTVTSGVEVSTAQRLLGDAPQRVRSDSTLSGGPIDPTFELSLGGGGTSRPPEPHALHRAGSKRVAG